MTVKKLKEVLDSLPEDMEVWWNDVVEGNSEPVSSLFLCETEVGEVLFVSPTLSLHIGNSEGTKVLYRARN